MSQISVTQRAAGAAEVPVSRAPYFPRKKKGISPQSIAIIVFLSMCALFFCIPLYVVVVTSFKTMDQIREGAIFALPQVWTLDAWDHAWNRACSGINCNGLKVGFWNSVMILFPSLALSIGLSMVTGYALALWNVRWAGGFLFLLFICAFVPFQIIMYPLIVMTSTAKVYGTLWGVAIIHAVLAMPVLTLIFRNYYKDIPQEIMSAAVMDSGSFWKIFIEIILPMSGNILIVVLILQITNIWNDYLIGVTFGGLNGQPMTVNLANLVTISTGTTNYAHNMAAALLTAIPPLVVYFVVGKLFVQGVTSGAIKG
ncbi:carbohydrate ABC transporter permease [Devosia sp. J2-20]|jgi:glucose/mannose transport system permease protein|uniref:carbohydrate ABC transporter permease n=1 Tax=Devosia TaxID=46913 RepID=UPI0022AE8EFF|nr:MULTISPECIES: carbohydrate ABC transporter permease [Devosia]MCZ4347688.1 carbohydrate ABC transporter permease [Devosia neptuniae]WDQ99966.1 carbohydrate ABC transporter permease [Devosia sp. J2-20]|tara:strand:- start:69887 stop:70822 length:936 start_codon:yes stop_codon:yes gene_type:complete